MDFKSYPLDEQNCEIELESTTTSEDNLVLRWSESDPFTFSKDFQFIGFEFSNYSLYDDSSCYKTGKFSKLGIRFHLERTFGHFLLDIYVPSILFVITSWLTFWIEVPAAPARVTGKVYILYNLNK